MLSPRLFQRWPIHWNKKRHNCVGWIWTSLVGPQAAWRFDCSFFRAISDTWEEIAIWNGTDWHYTKQQRPIQPLLKQSKGPRHIPRVSWGLDSRPQYTLMSERGDASKTWAGHGYRVQHRAVCTSEAMSHQKQAAGNCVGYNLSRFFQWHSLAGGSVCTLSFRVIYISVQFCNVNTGGRLRLLFELNGKEKGTETNWDVS